MIFSSCRSNLSGTIEIPGSKSHTIRAVLIASLANGISKIYNPLASADTESAIHVYGKLGARFTCSDDVWEVEGIGPDFAAPDEPLDVGNSGTTMRVLLGSCSLLGAGTVTITGDEQIQRRPCQPLVDALNELGGAVASRHGNGCAPFSVGGKLKGGRTRIEAQTSQYVTSLLFACPFAEDVSEIEVPLLYERPYVQMTLDWLAFQGVNIEADGLHHFTIPGQQRFRPFSRSIPADFSSAAFFLVAGALGENAITCAGLDINDSQSDKAVVDFLAAMGAEVSINNDEITVSSGNLRGIEIDMNDCPDALPIMAVAGCFAAGTTRLLNVPQARIKETDRISVMREELTKMGARIDELEDGLVIHQSELTGARVRGHGDHRVVMALTIAGLAASGTTYVDTAEASSVTFPTFQHCVTDLGGTLQVDASD